MGDFDFGYLPADGVRNSEAVAAASVFPFAIAPLSLKIAKETKLSWVDHLCKKWAISEKRNQVLGNGDISISLADGGVYDNLGVEPVWGRFNNLLITDAGRPFSSALSCSPFVVSRLARSSDHWRANRRGEETMLIERFENGLGGGAFWGIDTQIENYNLKDASGFAGAARDPFPHVRTDVNAFTLQEMDCIENHGYSLADAEMRSRGHYFCTNPRATFNWPRSNMCTDAAIAEALAESGKISFKKDLIALIEGHGNPINRTPS